MARMMERVKHELQDKNLDLKKEMTKMESTLEGLIHEREVQEIKEEELVSYEKQLELQLLDAMEQREKDAETHLAEISELKSSREFFEKEVNTLQHQVAELKSAHDERKAEVFAIQQEKAELEARVKSLVQAEQDLSLKLEQLNNELKLTMEKVEKVSSAYQKDSIKYEDDRKQFAIQESLFKKRIVTLESSLEEETKAHQTLDDQMKVEVAAKLELSAALGQSQLLFNKKQEEYVALDEKHQAHIDLHSKFVVTAESEISQLNERISGHMETIALRNTEIHELNNNLVQVQSKLGSVEQELAHVVSVKSQLSEQLAVTGSALEKEISEHSFANDVISGLKTDLETLTNQHQVTLQLLEENQQELQTSRDQLALETSKLEQQKEAAKQETDKLNLQLEELVGAKARLESELHATVSALAEQTASVENLSSQLYSTRSDLASMKESHAFTSGTLAAAESRLAQLAARLEEQEQLQKVTELSEKALKEELEKKSSELVQVTIAKGTLEQELMSVNLKLQSANAIVEELTLEKDSLIETVKANMARIEQLQIQLSETQVAAKNTETDLNTIISEKQTAMESQEILLENTRSTLVTVKQNLEEKFKEISLLNDNVKEEKAESLRLAQTLATVQTALALAEQMGRELSETVTSKTEKISELEKAVAQEQGIVLEKMQIESELRKDLDHVKSVVMEKDGEITKLETVVQDLKLTNNLESEKIVKLTEMLRLLEQVQEELNNEVSLQKQELNVANEKSEKLLKSLEEKDHSLCDAEAKLVVSRQELSVSVTNYTELNVRHETTIQQLSTLQSSFQNLEIQLEKQQEQHKQLIENLTKQEILQVEMEKEKEKLQVSLDQKSRLFNLVQQQKSELEENFAGIIHERNRLKEELMKKNEFCEQLRKDFEEHSKKFESIIVEKEKKMDMDSKYYLNQISQLSSQVKKCEAELNEKSLVSVSSLQKSLTSMTSENEALKDTLKHSHEKIRSLGDDIQRERTAQKMLKRALEERGEEMKTMAEDHKKTKLEASKKEQELEMSVQSLTDELIRYKEMASQFLTPEQARQIEEENRLLMQEKDFNWAELQKLSDVNAKLVGHSNPKQKINYHYKIKEENTVLKREKSALQSQVTKLESEVKRLRNLESIVNPISDKENLLSTSMLSMSTPSKGLSKTIETTPIKKDKRTALTQMSKTMHF